MHRHLGAAPGVRCRLDNRWLDSRDRTFSTMASEEAQFNPPTSRTVALRSRPYTGLGGAGFVRVTMGLVTAGPAARRWVAARVAHPTGDLGRSAAFYRDLLGLQPRGGFAGHDGYDGIFFALPGGGELELTAGPVQPRPGTDEDLLVLYLPTLHDVRQTAAELEAAGVPTVPAANPYWNRWGQVFLDPDGYAVVIAATPPDRVTAVPGETD